MLQEIAPEVRILTVMIIGWSKRMEVIGVEYIVEFSGEQLWQGKARFDPLPASVAAWLCPDHQLNGAHHPEHSTDSGVASSDG
jgi:hypothetical protein